MANKNKVFKGKLNQRAQSWFDQTDDSIPFDAFGDTDNKNRIGAEIFSKINKEIHHVRTVKMVFMRIAAAIVLITSIGILSSKYIPGLQLQHIGSEWKENGYVWKEYNAHSGKIQTVVLSDQSVVTLRPGTKLYVPASFDTHNRVVKLVGGEAFFKIKHDPQHPFIVHTGKISTKVLGTSFNIKNTLNTNEVEVAVSTGKVQVSDQRHVLAYLTKGKLIKYNTESNQFMLDSTNVAYVAVWSKVSVNLDNVTFKELSYVFNSFYGLELYTAGANVQKLRYTLTIDRKTGAESTLKIIAKIHGLYFNQKDGKVILYR